jgi:hypothetical protein
MSLGGINFFIASLPVHGATMDSFFIMAAQHMLMLPMPANYSLKSCCC